LAEHNPDVRQLYDEFKGAISAARDPYTGEARLLDVLVNLGVFPSNWGPNTQVIQFLQ
jgi:hypothetical protein